MMKTKHQAKCPHCGRWVDIVFGKLEHHEGGEVAVTRTPIDTWARDDDEENHGQHEQVTFGYRTVPRCKGSGKPIDAK